MEEKNPFTIGIEDIKCLVINFTVQAYTKKKTLLEDTKLE